MALSPKKILLIQLRQIGDVLLTTPAAQVLKDNFPGAKLDLLTQAPCHEVLSGNPFVDETLVYSKANPLKWIREVRERKYDLVIDFMSNPRSALICFASGAPLKAGPAYTSSSWAYNLKLTKSPLDHPYNPFFKIDLLKALGLKNIFYPYPKMYLSGQELLDGSNKLKELGITKAGRLIGFAPASRRLTRQWPPEHYAELGRLITDHAQNKVIVFWGPGEKDLAAKITNEIGAGKAILAPETKTLRKLASLIANIDLLVSNFNGPKHIATSLGISTLSIYGMCNPSHWTPPNDDKHRTIANTDAECISCYKTKCPNKLICLTGLKAADVFTKLREMLIESGSRKTTELQTPGTIR
ncbi:MAG TPA: hypothetical protein DCL44_09080 [Elusimicrobia bacterium]|nr:hypothetical protein [Elusimicrobiota bacterium]